MTAPVSCPVEDLVPGDIVHLRPGSMVPADLRLLSADDLELSEATFSGRPVPVTKSAAAEHADRNNRRHICYCGTHVLRGGGIGVVFATGARTRLGEMARRTSPHRPPGPFEKGVREVSMALLAFMVALVPTVFFLNGILKGNWTEAFLFGLAAAIGLTPELLPMMVNVNLARAAGVLARRGVITRTLPAVQELGSIDVLCVEPAGGGIRSEGATSSTPDLVRMLAEAREEGVEIRLLTEEPVGSLEALRESLGLTRAAVLDGSEVASLADEVLAERCGQTFLFAGLAPSDKARVVTALQSEGHRVGFLGGGANDANALRAADVGIVQTGAADLALDCAGVVLTTREPEALAAAMAEGRTAFGNILKYIKITASSNLGNAVSVVVASLLLPFLPIKAVLLLVQNLLYDLTQFFLPWDRVDASFRKVPRAWSADSLVRFMLVFAPVSCVFDLLTFGVLWWGVGARTPKEAPLFHTGWFSVGLLTQLMIVHVLRTGKPLWQSPPATAPLFLATLMAAAVGLILPHLPLASSLGFSILPAWFYVWLALVLCAYAATAEVVKRWYVARTGQWL
jgi:magnesium-transporting ATPase (P-type)